MQRLAESTLAQARAERPHYDRRAVRCGIVHLGLGAFARAHLAVYVDTLLAQGHHGLGIVGVSLRNDDVPNALGPQDGLYTLAVTGAAPVAHRIIGSVLRTLHAPSAQSEVRAALAAPGTSIVTITVTEKGYCWDPATRRLDHSHPDIRHDLEHPDVPRSLLGHLLLAARDRRATVAGPLTLLSLDNIPANGTTLRAVLTEMAEIGDPTLAEWIDEHLSVPCSVVDRMVPATDDAFRVETDAAVGVHDSWPIRAEPYSQWVVEQGWASPIPPLADVGVQIVEDVARWETLKLRVVNGLHTTAALYGLRRGLDTVDEVVADPGGRALLDRVAAEIAGVIEAPPGVEVSAYIATTFERFANPSLAHRCAQIASDTSQKLPQRLLDTARQRLARGLPIDAIADVLALWAWSTLGRDHLGRPVAVIDPLAPTYADIAADNGDDPRARRRAGRFGADLRRSRRSPRARGAGRRAADGDPVTDAAERIEVDRGDLRSQVAHRPSPRRYRFASSNRAAEAHSPSAGLET